MTRFTNRLTGLSLAILLTTPAWADLDSMVLDCDGCHGPDGISAHGDMPTIAGVSEFFLEDSMFVYADGARPCNSSEYRHGDTSRAARTMCEVAADMSEEDMAAIAAYYAEKPFVATKQDFDPALADAGKAIHDKDCEKCHTDGGTNPDEDAGILAGQPMDYLRQNFADYASEARSQPKTMKRVMDELNEADVEALLHFYASQQ